MLRIERIDSLPDLLLTALSSWQAGMWTALPGIVQDFNPTERTCTVKPAIQARVSAPDGSKSWVTLPLLLDCPVHFPSGGGYTLTFPIQNGDECLVVFSSRCLDAWWASGKISRQQVMRMHDLSDGIVFVGLNSTPKVIPNISTTSTQLRSDDGATMVELAPGAINVVTTTAVTLTAPTINLQNAGAALKKLVNDTFITLFNNHRHSGVSPGGSVTGTPLLPATSANVTDTVNAE